jgi:hypothetical protein
MATDPPPTSDGRDRFRVLPDPLRLEETVEMVDTTSLPPREPAEERDRMLREAGGGG